MRSRVSRGIARGCVGRISVTPDGLVAVTCIPSDGKAFRNHRRLYKCLWVPRQSLCTGLRIEQTSIAPVFDQASPEVAKDYIIRPHSILARTNRRIAECAVFLASGFAFPVSSPAFRWP